MKLETEIALCKLCGEPMPDGEQMFNYHGYSGLCPLPPQENRQLFLEYFKVDQRGATFLIEVRANGAAYSSMSFRSATERDNALNDLLMMMRSMGGKDGSTANN